MALCGRGEAVMGWTLREAYCPRDTSAENWRGILMVTIHEISILFAAMLSAIVCAHMVSAVHRWNNRGYCASAWKYWIIDISEVFHMGYAGGFAFSVVALKCKSGIPLRVVMIDVFVVMSPLLWLFGAIMLLMHATQWLWIEHGVRHSRIVTFFSDPLAHVFV
jgi:hypothetical protein